MKELKQPNGGSPDPGGGKRMVIVDDGTDDAEAILKRVLRNDPAMGVIRYRDPGYKIAGETAKKNGLYINDKL